MVQMVLWAPERLKEIILLWKPRIRDIRSPKLDDPNMGFMGLTGNARGRLRPKHACPCSLIAQQLCILDALGFTLNVSNRTHRPWFVQRSEKCAAQLAFPHTGFRTSTWMETYSLTCQRN